MVPFVERENLVFRHSLRVFIGDDFLPSPVLIWANEGADGRCQFCLKSDVLANGHQGYSETANLNPYMRMMRSPVISIPAIWTKMAPIIPDLLRPPSISLCCAPSVGKFIHAVLECLSAGITLENDVPVLPVDHGRSLSGAAALRLRRIVLAEIVVTRQSFSENQRDSSRTKRLYRNPERQPSYWPVPDT